MPIQQVSEARDYVVSTIRQVAASQNADFKYLLNQAQVESSLNPRAKAATSSAAGLYQFTSGTWVEMVKRHGDQVGLGDEAQSLRFNTASPADRARILDLRNQPETATAMAAFFAADNAQALSAAGHKSIGPTELYLAHFLGASGAATFLNGLRDSPTSSAAKALPQAAAANAAIFFDNGGPRSYQDIYNRFAQKFNDAPSVSAQLANSALPKLDRSTISFDTRLRQIVAAALASDTRQVSPSDTVSAPAIPVTDETMSKYLKNFSLVDHASGMTQVSDPRARDASQGASSSGGDAPLNPQSLSPIASGVRMILKAVDQTNRENGSDAATR